MTSRDGDASPGPDAGLIHTASGRSPRAALVLGALWLGVIYMWLGLQASPWVIAALIALSLPAAWDFATARPACLWLDETRLAWQSGTQTRSLRHAEIDHVLLDRRLDFSARARVVLRDGHRLTLPPDAMPPMELLEKKLREHDISMKPIRNLRV